jgi:hypothetical protein
MKANGKRHFGCGRDQQQSQRRRTGVSVPHGHGSRMSGCWAPDGRADSSCLATLALRNDKISWSGTGSLDRFCIFLCVRVGQAGSVSFGVGEINIKVKGDGQECPSHMSTARVGQPLSYEGVHGSVLLRRLGLLWVSYGPFESWRSLRDDIGLGFVDYLRHF